MPTAPQSCPISYATLWASFKCYPTARHPVNQAICILLFDNCILHNLVAIKIIIIIIVIIIIILVHIKKEEYP